MQKSIIIATVAAILAGGCVVVPTYEVYRPVPAPPPPPEPEVVVAGPVFEAPGVEIIDVEPAPYDRVYVYDPGYPRAATSMAVFIGTAATAIPMTFSSNAT
jgi:hypothetical protein